ncbi:hypothetical protein [Alteromonas sp. ASW11-130]|uniref:hypothetical protein n=1 Tax=Alteromonas sp. ASW11-130 TaxID=3015775 RepID=UPI0022429C63|nr:hypothetical protein [Alteromonas sp. ASW11-130]MCW8091255.1 hypothetical protein [Alteromonas sp. ASW11-130]
MDKSVKALIKTANSFEAYVKNIWPIHRKFAKNKISRRCTRCAASEHMIKLDDEICDVCKTLTLDEIAIKKDYTGNLNEAIESAFGSGNYDILIAYSGGKDSTYLVKKIREKYPNKRLLLFTIDNGFMSPVAKLNIETLLPQLGEDHVFIRPAKEFFAKMFAYGLQHLNDEGGYGTVDFSDGEFMIDSGKKLAAQKGIPLILIGYSRYQVTNGLKLDTFTLPKTAKRSTVAGLEIAKFHDQDEQGKWFHNDTIPEVAFPFFVWDLEEEEIIAHLVEWGLLHNKNLSPIATNHALIPVIGVVDVHNKGYSSYEKEFCTMIRDGKADYVKWRNTFEFLEYTSNTGLFVKPLVDESLAELGLCYSDVGIKW